MKADSITITEINNANFSVPIYHRNYIWNEEQCARLLDDIAKIIASGTEHFFGTMTFAKTSENEYIIIDGHQRLETIKIFVKALNDCANNINDTSTSKNYKICLTRVQEWINQEISPDKILAALNLIRIVKIELDSNDDRHAIFESINSTGQNLSQADLIRNFLLIDEQQELLSVWQKINSQTDINIFFAHYITFITSNEVSGENLYKQLVKIFESKNLSRSDFLNELAHLSEIYKVFTNKDSDSNYPPEVMKYLEILRTLKQISCYPFLLHVFNDYENQIIDSQTLIKTVKLIFCYVIRRIICKLPDNKLASLYGRANKQNYYESINKSLVLPDDSTFANALMTSDIYLLDSNLCKFLLTEIENGDSSEILCTDNLTIEHIMPQSLTPEWQSVISSIEHKLYLHTLGNLTMTGYNLELANKNFLDKKIILSRSKAVILNSDLINKTSWTVKEITERGRRLANILVRRFSPEKMEAAEKIIKVSLSNAPEKVTGKDLDSFMFDNKIYKQNNYASMLLEVVKLLDKDKPTILAKIAKKGYSFTEDKKIYISADSKLLQNPKQIRDGIYIEMGIDTKTIMKFIDSLFARFSVKKSRFQILITAQE